MLRSCARMDSNAVNNESRPDMNTIPQSIQSYEEMSRDELITELYLIREVEVTDMIVDSVDSASGKVTLELGGLDTLWSFREGHRVTVYHDEVEQFHRFDEVMGQLEDRIDNDPDHVLPVIDPELLVDIYTEYEGRPFYNVERMKELDTVVQSLAFTEEVGNFDLLALRWAVALHRISVTSDTAMDSVNNILEAENYIKDDGKLRQEVKRLIAISHRLNPSTKDDLAGSIMADIALYPILSEEPDYLADLEALREEVGLDAKDFALWRQDKVKALRDAIYLFRSSMLMNKTYLAMDNLEAEARFIRKTLKSE